MLLPPPAQPTITTTHTQQCVAASVGNCLVLREDRERERERASSLVYMEICPLHSLLLITMMPLFVAVVLLFLFATTPKKLCRLIKVGCFLSKRPPRSRPPPHAGNNVVSDRKTAKARLQKQQHHTRTHNKAHPYRPQNEAPSSSEPTSY